MFEEVASYYYNLGLQNANEKNISVAIEYLKKSVGFDTDNTACWNLLGLCYFRLGQFKMADFCWQQSSQKGNESSQRYIDLLSSGEYLSKIEVYIEKIASLVNYSLQGKYKKLIKLLTPYALRVNYRTVDLENYYGLLQYLAGNRKKARKTWENVLEIDKSNPKALLYLTYIINEKRQNRLLRNILTKSFKVLKF